MAAASTAPRAEPVWYVQAADRVWGPYPHARLEGFVGEGRLTGQSLVASQASGPFGPAERRRELQALFPPQGAAAPDSHASPAAAPATGPAAHANLVRPLLVWATLQSLTPARFESVLAAYGPFQAIRRELWLIRAALGPAPLRNALSRRLRSQDTLLVVEAPLSSAAWFNLEGSAERTLRHLWGGGEG